MIPTSRSRGRSEQVRLVLGNTGNELWQTLRERDDQIAGLQQQIKGIFIDLGIALETQQARAQTNSCHKVK